MNNSVVKGYKVFLPDWTCRPGWNFKQYTCPGEFEEDINLVIGETGMHFCKKLIDCFDYYDFNSKNKVAEVEAYGDVVEGLDMLCTNKLRIIRELNLHEVLYMVNSEARNTGKHNIGKYNSGDYNSGDYNSGNCNSYNYNSGDYNRGYFNSGDCNSGDRNSGYYNSGHYNSGDFNSGNHSSGVFNTDKKVKIMMFNKQSDWTYDDWILSDARYILMGMPFDETKWVPYKKDYDGFLRKNIVTDEERNEWWRRLPDKNKNKIMSLPNFDKDIFKKITGIDIGK